MNIQNFNDYLAHCQKIKNALSCLPECNLGAVFAAWDAGRLFVPDWKDGCLPRFWINVGAHMSVAAVLGYQLALSMEDDLEKEGCMPRDIVESLLVHDWAKRLEIEFALTYKDMDRIAEFQSENVRALSKWFGGEKISNLAAAGGGSGMRIAEQRQLTLGERIVFFSDYSTSGSCVVLFPDRIAAFLPHFEKGGQYEAEGAYYQKRFGMSHNDWLTQTFSPIQAEFITRTGRPAEDFPKNLVPPEFCK